jgi:hypothetical protein
MDRIDTDCSVMREKQLFHFNAVKKIDWKAACEACGIALNACAKQRESLAISGYYGNLPPWET